MASKMIEIPANASDAIFDAVIAYELAKRGGPKASLAGLTRKELVEFRRIVGLPEVAACCAMVRR